MQTVITLKQHRFANKWRSPGDRYAISDGLARVFVKAGLVQIEERIVVKKPLPVAAPSPVQEQEDAEDGTRRKRQYRRRDMKPEE